MVPVIESGVGEGCGVAAERHVAIGSSIVNVHKRMIAFFAISSFIVPPGGARITSSILLTDSVLHKPDVLLLSEV
jgi:hypothetical protein